jgi:hypothetical protein
MATKAEREKEFIKQRAAELRAQGKPVDRAKLAERFDTLAKTKEGRQTITAAVQRAAAPAGSASAATPTQEEIDAEIARQDAFEDARSVESGGPSGLTIGGTEIGGGVVSGRTVASVEELVVNGRTIKRTTYVDGTFEDEDLGSADEDDEDEIVVDPFAAAQAAADTVAARALAQQRTDAFSRLQGLLSRVGLGELEGVVKNIISSGTVDLNDGNAILFAIREQPAYQRRFAGNAARRARGLAELDPSTYVGLEDSYRQLMQSNGLPAGFYDAANDFQKLIEGDVSPQELQERIEQGYRKVQDADPEVKRQMRELYGLGDTELAAYFLDPDKAATLLTRQARAAQIAARGREQGGLDLTRESAEALAARGITPEEAQAQFAQRGALAGLYNPLAGEEGLTQEEQLGATFGFDPVAREKLERRRAQRVAEFQGGGQFARTTGATSGTVETGIGTAS